MNFYDDLTPDILADLRDGDYKAFDRIYLRCFEPMQAFFRVLLRNDADAEEMCQDLFAKIWESRAKIDPRRNFRSYLYAMAKSAALNHLAHKNVVNKYIDFRLRGEPDVEHSPDQQLMSSEMSLILQISLERMPQQRRRVFEMSRMEGMTNDEIAGALGITPTTVRAHLHNATKELRELMASFIFFFMA